MKKVAIITAAGFKAVSSQIPGAPPACPECLLPIPAKHGKSSLERLSRQLGKLGFSVFATISAPDYCFAWRPRRHMGYYGFAVSPADVSTPPWTQERAGYISGFCTPLAVPNPDRYCYHDSAYRALDEIGYEWDQCLIVQGDHLFTDGLLTDLVHLQFPAQVRPSRAARAFTVLLLTPKAAQEYRRLGDTFRAANLHEWNGSRHSPTGFSAEGKEFATLAPITYVTDALPHHHEYEWSDDIDSPGAYQNVLEWLDRDGAAMEVEAVDFDRCIRAMSKPTLWMVKGQSRVAFKNWEEYHAAGEPPFDLVTQKEADGYQIVTRFA